MPAATVVAFKCSFVFVQQAGPRTAGWTMNFWNKTTELNEALNRSLALAPFLQKVVGKQAYLTWVSCRALYNPPGVKGVRIAQSVYLLKPGGPPNSKNPDADYPTNALLMELRTAGGTTVRQTIRALPDENVTLGGWYTPQGTSSKDIDSLLTQLGTAANAWSLVTQDPGQTPFPIQGFDSTTGQVKALNHGLAVGDIVTIGGHKIGVVPKINGRWKVSLVPDVNTFQLLDYPTNDTSPSGRFTSAYGQKYLRAVTQIVFDSTKNISSQVSFVTKRSVGRPTHQLTGKSKNKK